MCNRLSLRSEGSNHHRPRDAKFKTPSNTWEGCEKNMSSLLAPPRCQRSNYRNKTSRRSFSAGPRPRALVAEGAPGSGFRYARKLKKAAPALMQNWDPETTD